MERGADYYNDTKTEHTMNNATHPVSTHIAHIDRAAALPSIAILRILAKDLHKLATGGTVDPDVAAMYAGYTRGQIRYIADYALKAFESRLMQRWA